MGVLELSCRRGSLHTPVSIAAFVVDLSVNPLYVEVHLQDWLNGLSNQTH